MKHIWSLVSSGSKIDADTNNVSINDIYENLQFNLNTSGPYDPDKPFLVPFNFEVTSLFYRDKKGTEETYTEYVVILDPKGNQLGDMGLDFTFKPEHNRMRNRIKSDKIAFTQSGTYVFQVFSSKKGSKEREMVASIPLDIQVKIDGKDI